MPALEEKSVTLPLESHPDEIRWAGHMSDDVASTYGPEPMAFLSATPERLLLAGKRGTFEISRAAVLRLARGKMYPWFFRGVRICHRLPGLPQTLQFLPLDAPWRAVMERLGTLGYPLK